MKAIRGGILWGLAVTVLATLALADRAGAQTTLCPPGSRSSPRRASGGPK